MWRKQFVSRRDSRKASVVEEIKKGLMEKLKRGFELKKELCILPATRSIQQSFCDVECEWHRALDRNNVIGMLPRKLIGI